MVVLQDADYAKVLAYMKSLRNEDNKLVDPDSFEFAYDAIRRANYAIVERILNKVEIF